MDISTIFSKSKILTYLILTIVLSACGGVRINNALPFELRYLDDYLIPDDLAVEGQVVGGLSDLDFDGRYFYSVVDVPSKPRIYKMDIVINNGQIDTIQFIKAIDIQYQTEASASKVFDLEGLIYDAVQNQFIISSEGSIARGKDPFIANVNMEGEILDYYEIPEYFKADYPKGPRNNGVFEGLDRSVDGKGFWVAMELPLEMDGPKVKIYKTRSPVRFTYYDKMAKMPQKQFIYPLGRLRKLPLLPFGMNGVSGILEYAAHQFFVIERAFSAGHGSLGNRIMIYYADARQATNTLNVLKLRSRPKKSIISAQKHLVFDFNSVKKQLSKGFADNIEGLILGPQLSNGNQSLILLSDNNFNSFSKQVNQVILLEIVPK